MDKKRFVIVLHGGEHEETNNELVAAAYCSSMKRQGWKDVKYIDRKAKNGKDFISQKAPRARNRCR